MDLVEKLKKFKDQILIKLLISTLKSGFEDGARELIVEHIEEIGIWPIELKKLLIEELFNKQNIDWPHSYFLDTSLIPQNK
jgi:hypothetical protein